MAAVDVEKSLEQCFKGKHDLIEMFTAYDSPVSEQTVRWCRTCGSIVIDVDFDGRTNPGAIMKMKHPRYLIKE